MKNNIFDIKKIIKNLVLFVVAGRKIAENFIEIWSSRDEIFDILWLISLGSGFWFLSWGFFVLSHTGWNVVCIMFVVFLKYIEFDMALRLPKRKRKRNLTF